MAGRSKDFVFLVLSFAALRCATRVPPHDEPKDVTRALPAASVIAVASTGPLPPASSAELAFPLPKLVVAQQIRVSAATQARFEPIHPTEIVLGERWGCAKFGTTVGSTVQCWEAAASGSAARIQAWNVPWLRNASLLYGAPERLCEYGAPQTLKVRCWQRPKRGESAGAEYPAKWQWLNPNGAKWGDAYERSDRVDKVEVGGTFACLQATKDQSVWCLGDDHFGQLGGSSAVPPPHAEPDDPAFVQRIWPAQQLTVGTWHACAMAAPQGLANSGHIACWGRGDQGQLGAPAPDQCAPFDFDPGFSAGVADPPVACAKTPVKGVKFASAVLALSAGDLYTCMSTPEGTSCWGASRDGFFGKPGSCPPSLKRAWPTLHGSVAAPSAACSPKPVKVPAIKGFQQEMSVGPRGLCFEEGTPLKCLGAIRTPRAKGVINVVVSPGEDASACGMLNGEVVCWGDGYSKPGALDVPVPIAFEPPPVVTEIAVVASGDPAAYDPGCRIRRGCDFGPAPLPACAPNIQSTEWSALFPAAAQQLGQIVSVRGPIAVGPRFHTMVACPSDKLTRCCNRSSGSVVIGGAPMLALAPFFCTGDESQVCCNAPAYGQSVVASGRLKRSGEGHSHLESGFMLTDVTLCAPTP